ncbi:polygalacturonase-like [Prosopis cineraria]|uniref:polygalacturonase-like n=1 Tax=Prosopis cineraria TaxID=364024 RepID=UPI002410AB56|nr:polygalacturonase-like [Prosopis cineraria]
MPQTSHHFHLLPPPSPLLLSFFSIFFAFAFSEKPHPTFNVVSFGAHPSGESDSTDAFLAAWAQACRSPHPSAIYVPPGEFLVGHARFRGQCRNKAISIIIDGTLLAPSDYRSVHEEYWLLFELVDGVSIHGGVLDGRGASLWECKNSGGICPPGATTLGFSNSKNIRIKSLTSRDSQVFHIAFNGCRKVRVKHVSVVAAENSPNTDGIHVQYSSDVIILHSEIRTGDDCVSVGPGTSDLRIEHVACGPGHGISIGSLGREMEEPGVQRVTVKAVNLTGTQNGVRIKSWGRPSHGFVNRIVFHNIVMLDVHNPIIIDQNYCPDNINCPGQASGIKIGDVKYKNIPGTSASEVAVKFDCSSKHPCYSLRMEDVNLTYKEQEAQALCNNAAGTASAWVRPESCL